ncbi:MAG: hypothetical protein QRY74_00245 [Chlamydia sp.]
MHPYSISGINRTLFNTNVSVLTAIDQQVENQYKNRFSRAGLLFLSLIHPREIWRGFLRPFKAVVFSFDRSRSISERYDRCSRGTMSAIKIPFIKIVLIVVQLIIPSRVPAIRKWLLLSYCTYKIMNLPSSKMLDNTHNWRQKVIDMAVEMGLLASPYTLSKIAQRARIRDIAVRALSGERLIQNCAEALEEKIVQPDLIKDSAENFGVSRFQKRYPDFCLLLDFIAKFKHMKKDTGRLATREELLTYRKKYLAICMAINDLCDNQVNKDELARIIQKVDKFLVPNMIKFVNENRRVWCEIMDPNYSIEEMAKIEIQTKEQLLQSIQGSSSTGFVPVIWSSS